MQLRPNRTAINATITEVLDAGNFLKIVILSISRTEVLPAFLWVGKSLKTKNNSKGVAVASGDIISAEIEVFGDPFEHTYMLHNVTKNGNAKQANFDSESN